MAQLLRLTKSGDKGNLWVNPEQIIYAEVAERKEDKSSMTILHITGKDGKIFVKEHPDELNKIFEKYSPKQKFKLEQI